MLRELKKSTGAAKSLSALHHHSPPETAEAPLMASHSVLASIGVERQTHAEQALCPVYEKVHSPTRSECGWETT